MREHEIPGITRRKSCSLTKQDHTAPPAPDLFGDLSVSTMAGFENPCVNSGERYSALGVFGVSS